MKTPNLLSRKTRWVVIAVVVLALGGALAFWLSRDHGQQDALRLYGNVDIRDVNLAFRVGGRVSEVLVDEGDVIEAGQLLARLDPVPLAHQRDSARANLAAIEAANAGRVASAPAPSSDFRLGRDPPVIGRF